MNSWNTPFGPFQKVLSRRSQMDAEAGSPKGKQTPDHVVSFQCACSYVSHCSTSGIPWVVGGEDDLGFLEVA